MQFSVIKIGQSIDGGDHPVTYRAIDGTEMELGAIAPDSKAPDGGDLHAWVRGKLRTRNDRDRAELGDHLHTLLNASEWPEELMKCPDCLPGSPGLHLDVVFDIATPELRALPWELLRRDEGYLFQLRGHHCVRSLGFPSGPKSARRRELPIKVLILVGTSLDEIAADEELDRVYKAIGKYQQNWHLSVKHQPEWDVVEKLVDTWRPHILHVISHSANRAGSAAGMGGQMWWELDVEAIKLLYRDNRPRPLLFLLNFCDSARMAPLLHTGQPDDGSVISMQSNVKGEASASFAGEFYASLVLGAGFSPATFAGRDKLVAGEHYPEWPFPVLDLAPDGDGQLSGLSELNHRRDVLLPEFADHHVPALGRHKELDELCKDHPLVGISGDRDTGKTYLAQWYLFTRRLLGEVTVHLDLRTGGEVPETQMDQRTALSLAVDAVQRRSRALIRSERMSPEDFDPVVSELERLSGALGTVGPLITVEEAYDRFVDCLDQIATLADRDVVFVFDGVEWISSLGSDFTEVMVGRGLSPRGRSRLIATSTKGFRDWKLRNLPVVELGPYRPEEYLDIGLEAARKVGLEDKEGMIAMAKAMKSAGTPLLPQTVHSMLRLIYPSQVTW